MIVHLLVDCCSGEIINSEFILDSYSNCILIYCSLEMSAKDKKLWCIYWTIAVEILITVNAYGVFVQMYSYILFTRDEC